MWDGPFWFKNHPPRQKLCGSTLQSRPQTQLHVPETLTHSGLGGTAKDTWWIRPAVPPTGHWVALVGCRQLWWAKVISQRSQKTRERLQSHNSQARRRRCQEVWLRAACWLKGGVSLWYESERPGVTSSLDTVRYETFIKQGVSLYFIVPNRPLALISLYWEMCRFWFLF